MTRKEPHMSDTAHIDTFINTLREASKTEPSYNYDHGNPTSPLIIITNGYLREDSIAGSVATPVDIDFPEEDYYLITGVKAGFTVSPGKDFTTWEDATAVQNTTLERVCDAFQGSELTEEQDMSIELLKAYTY